MDSIYHFANKRILVVGASSGIGRATATLLSRQGAKVVLIARTREKLEETLASLEGDGHSIYPSDVSEVDRIDELVERIVEHEGPLDGMVYSAGMTEHVPLRLLKPEKIMKVFAVNFYGYVEMIRAVTKKGRYTPGMRIVGVSSIAARKGDKSHISYSASKAAMDSAVRCIAKEVAEKQIYINNVAPALVATSMSEQLSVNNGKEDRTIEILMDRQYLGMVQTDDVANAIVFLLSPQARAITGSVLTVDCGLMTN